MSIIVQKKDPVIRVAFCGSMGSGKTYASNLLREKIDARVLSIAKPIKEIVSDMGKSDRASHIMVGSLGRELDKNVWVKRLLSRIDAYETSGVNELVVDDVRYENEALALKDRGFILVYLKTPWHVRFQRIRERTDDLTAHIQWFAHESEISPETMDRTLFDYICESEEHVDNVINEICGITI